MDEFITKSIKWMSLLSPRSGRVCYKVHKVDEFVTKSTKWTSLLLSPQSGHVYY